MYIREQVFIQVGNPDFNPEFNLQEDMGLNFTSQYAVINLSGFYNSISNYIFNEKILNADGTDSTRDDNMVYQYRQGRAAFMVENLVLTFIR